VIAIDGKVHRCSCGTTRTDGIHGSALTKGASGYNLPIDRPFDAAVKFTANVKAFQQILLRDDDRGVIQSCWAGTIAPGDSSPRNQRRVSQ
jgi:hypothetical protein